MLFITNRIRQEVKRLIDYSDTHRIIRGEIDSDEKAKNILYRHSLAIGKYNCNYWVEERGEEGVFKELSVTCKYPTKKSKVKEVHKIVKLFNMGKDFKPEYIMANFNILEIEDMAIFNLALPIENPWKEILEGNNDAHN